MGIFDIFGGEDSGKYFDEASKVYKEYGEKSLDEIRRGRIEGRKDITTGKEEAIGYQEPYIGAGKEALTAYLDSLGIGQGAKGEQGVYNKFTTSPGYQFALKQGIQAVQAQNAARGLGGSGAEQAELQRLGQGMAEQSFDKYLQNHQNRLSELAGMGRQSALAGSEIAIGAGRDLSRLGLEYTGATTGVLGNIGKSSAEALMAKGAMKSQESQSFWKGLGSVAGGALTLL